MVIPSDPFGETTIGFKDSGFKPDGFKWSERPARLQHRFLVLRKLGQGTYGKVQLALNKETNREVAIKTIKKARIESEEDMLRIRREIHIMNSISHPHIIHINEVFETRQKIVLVMQYASGGELYDYLGCHQTLPEEEARRLFRQIASAIYYCHKNKICHRDLKLENILLDEEGNAQIADFGLSNIFDERQRMNTFCGSPLYASPEIVKGTPYKGPEVDCWSLGVLLYTLIYGTMPFDGRNFKDLVSQISDGRYEEPINKSNASGLIRCLLTPEISRRATILEVCKDSWVNKGYNETLLKVAEEMSSEAELKTKKTLIAKSSLAKNIKNGPEKQYIPKALCLKQNEGEHSCLVNGNSEHITSLNGGNPQKKSLHEQILNYDVSFVINKLLAVVESTLTNPKTESNSPALTTPAQEKTLPTFKAWPRNGESNQTSKVESAYVIPIFEVTSIVPKSAGKIIRSKDCLENTNHNIISNGYAHHNSELLSRNTSKSNNVKAKKKQSPNKINGSSSPKAVNGVNVAETSVKTDTKTYKQISDFQSPLTLQRGSSQQILSEKTLNEHGEAVQSRKGVTTEGILSRNSSVKAKRTVENSFFGQKHLGLFYRNKNHTLSLARIFSMNYETLVLKAFKMPERKQRVPGKIEIPATFDPSTAPSQEQERKQIDLFPTVSVSENKEKIEKKIDKIKKAALNMNLIRRSNSTNRLKIQKFLMSQAKKMQDLVFDEKRSISGSFEQLNRCEGYPIIPDSYFPRFESGNAFSTKLHNKKINFMYSKANHSNSSARFNAFFGETCNFPCSGDSQVKLPFKSSSFSLAKSKSDIQFPVYSNFNELEVTSNFLSLPNGFYNSKLLRSASDSEGLSFTRNISTIDDDKENCRGHKNHYNIQVNKTVFDGIIFNANPLDLNSNIADRKIDNEINHLHADRNVSSNEEGKHDSTTLAFNNLKSMDGNNIHRSASENSFPSFQNVKQNNFEHLQQLSLLLETGNLSSKICHNTSGVSEEETNTVNKTNRFSWITNASKEGECSTAAGKKNVLRRRNTLSSVSEYENGRIFSKSGNLHGKSIDSHSDFNDYLWTPRTEQHLLMSHQKNEAKYLSSPNLCNLRLRRKVNCAGVNDSKSVDCLNIQANSDNGSFYQSTIPLHLSIRKSSETSAFFRRILQAPEQTTTSHDFHLKCINRSKSIGENALTIDGNDEITYSTHNERKLSLPQGIFAGQNNQKNSPFFSKVLNDLELREQALNTSNSGISQRRPSKNTFSLRKRSKQENRSKSFLQLLSLKRIQEAEKALDRAQRNVRIDAEEEANADSLLEALKTHGYKGVISQRFQGVEDNSADAFNIRNATSPYLTRRISPDISQFKSMYYDTLPHLSTPVYEVNDLDPLEEITLQSPYEIGSPYMQNFPKQFVYDWLATSQNAEYTTPFNGNQDPLLETEVQNNTKTSKYSLNWGKEINKSFDEASSSESFDTPKEQCAISELGSDSGRMKDYISDYAEIPTYAKIERTPMLRTSSTSEDEREESVQDRIWRKSFYSRFNNSALSRKDRSSFLESQFSSEGRSNCLSSLKVPLDKGSNTRWNGLNKDFQSKRIHTAKKYSSTNDVSIPGCSKIRSPKHTPVLSTGTYNNTSLTSNDEEEPEH